MCGIVGVVSSAGITDWQKRAKWFAKALLVDVFRGEDSTGVIGVDKLDQSIFTYKKAMPSYDFLQLKQVDWMLTNFDNFRYVVGHNRAATVGGVNHKNAHPFVRGPISLVHNGTLWSRHGIDRTIIVDSDAIAHALSLVEPDQAKEVLEKLDGPFALVWHDSRDNSFHMVRNKERPMHFAFNEKNDTMYYASEPWMIRDIHPIDVKKIWNLNPGWHIIIPQDLHDLSKYTEEKIELLDWAEPSWRQTGTSGWNWEKEGRADGKKHGNVTQMTTSAGSHTQIGGNGNTQCTNNHHLTGNNETKETRAEKKARMKAEKKERRNSSMRDVLQSYGYSWREKVVFSITQFQKFAGKPQIGMAYGQVEEHGDDVTYADKITAYDVPCEIVTPFIESGRLAEILFVGEAIAASVTNEKLEVILDNVEFYVPEAEGEQTEELVMGPDGDYITETEFNKLTAKGCAFCTDNVHFEDADMISWTDDRRPLCADCQEYGEAMLSMSGVNKQ